VTRARRPRAAAKELPASVWAWLNDQYDDSGDGGERFFELLEAEQNAAALWSIWGADIVNNWISAHPGTRPSLWWRFNAPEPRGRLGGTGTQREDCLALIEHYRFGVFDLWRSATIDPRDPPAFESEAAYLERLGLLLPAERKRLGPEDFKPVSILDILDLDEAED
jgi:hypothetical protein